MSIQRSLLSRLAFPILFGIGAVVLAGLAQYAHTFAGQDATGIVLFAAALVYWIAAIFAYPSPVEAAFDGQARPEPALPPRVRYPFLAGAIALAFVTFVTSSRNMFTADNALSWLLAIVVFLYACWEPEKNAEEWRERIRTWLGRARRSLEEGIVVPAWAGTFLVILLVGIFFYLGRLGQVPAEMTSDHAEVVYGVHDLITNGTAPIFFEGSTEREPLEIYLVAALVKLGGQPLDFETLKLTTTVIGLLAIPAAFLLARELFATQVAMVTAALMAVSKWPVTMARLGLCYALAPVLVCLLAFFVLRGLKYQHRNDFLLAGLLLGLGLYAYNALVVAPVLVGFWVLVWVLVRRDQIGEPRRLAVNLLLLFAMVLVVAMPWLRYTTTHSQNPMQALTGLLAESSATGSLLRTLGRNASRTVLMFNWTSDRAWTNAVSGDNALGPISGGLFFLGFVFALFRLVRYRDWVYGLVLVALAIMLLPSVLRLATPEENPSLLRALGSAPFAFMIVALPLVWIGQVVRAKIGRISAVLVVVLTLASIGVTNYIRYFNDYDASYRASSWNSSEIAQAIASFANSVGSYDHAFLVAYPDWVDARNVGINMGMMGWQQTVPDLESMKARRGDGSSQLYVLNPDDKTDLQTLQEIFRNGQLRTFNSKTPGKNFDLWYVPGTIAPDAPVTSR